MKAFTRQSTACAFGLKTTFFDGIFGLALGLACAVLFFLRADGIPFAQRLPGAVFALVVATAVVSSLRFVAAFPLNARYVDMLRVGWAFYAWIAAVACGIVLSLPVRRILEDGLQESLPLVFAAEAFAESVRFLRRGKFARLLVAAFLTGSLLVQSVLGLAVFIALVELSVVLRRSDYAKYMSGEFATEELSDDCRLLIRGGRSAARMRGSEILALLLGAVVTALVFVGLLGRQGGWNVSHIVSGWKLAWTFRCSPVVLLVVFTASFMSLLLAARLAKASRDLDGRLSIGLFTGYLLVGALALGCFAVPEVLAARPLQAFRVPDAPMAALLLANGFALAIVASSLLVSLWRRPDPNDSRMRVRRLVALEKPIAWLLIPLPVVLIAAAAWGACRPLSPAPVEGQGTAAVAAVGRKDTAVDKALRSNANFRIGMYYFRQKDYSGAIRYFERARVALPANERLLEAMVQSYEAVGDQDKLKAVRSRLEAIRTRAGF